MSVIAFKSQDGVETVSRVLGYLQRMGFALHNLGVSRGVDGRFRVRLDYEVVGALSAETFEARVTQIPGVEDVVSNAAEADIREAPAPARTRDPSVAAVRFA